MDMIRTLFHAQDLRDTIIGYFQLEGTQKPLEKALKALVADQVISESERIEIEKLVDYRNHIAHRLEKLNADIGHTRFANDLSRFGSAGWPKYDYAAVKRLRFYRKSLPKRTQRKYDRQLSIAPLLFEATERALKIGLRRLRRTIDRQSAARKLENAKLHAELSLDGTDLTGDLHPNHPLNQYESGNLTARGVEVCYRLLDAGKSPMAVAHLMRISLASATRRKRMWEAAGGTDRERHDFSAGGNSAT
jgi:hypothetical protein